VRENDVDLFNLPAVSFNNSISIREGNKTGTLSFVVIILLTDDAPKADKQSNNKETNELRIIPFLSSSSVQCRKKTVFSD